MASDTKKRRLAALEQREHGPSTSTPKQVSLAHSGAASSPASRKKRFQGQSPADNKAQPAATPPDSVYATLHDSAQTGPSGISSGLHEPMDDPGDFVDDLLHRLLASSRKVVNPSAALESKLPEKCSVLLDNPGGPAAVARADRVRRRHHRHASKRSSHHMTARQHRLRGTHNIPPELHLYDLYLPLHGLWKSYISTLLSDASSASVESRLLTADFHGSILTVVRAKDPTLVGKAGIVVKETANAFSVVTLDNQLRVLPKRGMVFQVQVGEMAATMFGDALLALRATRQVGATQRRKKETVEL